MKGGHVNNEHNDGMDNDPELLREGHSSHSQTYNKMNTKNERSRGAHIRTPMNRHIQQSDPSNTSIHIPNDREDH